MTERPSIPNTLWSNRSAFASGLAGCLLLLLLADGIYLLTLWPDWQALQSGPTPKSQIIQDYIEENPGKRLIWKPINHPISKSQARAFVIAEDSRFYSHSGIDLQAIWDAIIYNWKAGKVVVGASTITQQTAKNLFLSHDRNLLRKWHEAVLSLALENQLNKTQILRHYLNIAEFGKGIYGVEAAAQHYYGRSFQYLSLYETAGLAASLPSPKKHNPASRTSFFQKRQTRILRRLQRVIPNAFVQQEADPTEDEELDTVELLPPLTLPSDEDEPAMSQLTPEASPTPSLLESQENSSVIQPGSDASLKSDAPDTDDHPEADL